MTSSTSENSQQNRRHSDQHRLESWKAIANYLHRSVRTVRRWEAREKLPVHRHQHTRGSSVFAFCSELDEWRQRRQQSVEQGIPETDEPAIATAWLPSAARYAAIALVAAFIGGFAGKSLLGPATVVPEPVTSADAALVMITALPDADSTRNIGIDLTAALRRNLSQVGNSRVLPMKRVHDILTLMRQDLHDIVSPAIAREVALRDGNVRAVLIPHVEQLGDTFVISVEITDPVENLLLAYPSETSTGATSVLTTIEHLARSVQAELDRLPEAPLLARLPEVTTSSMAALHLYARALRLLDNDRSAAARELLGLAIAEDPEFASAQALQAWALKLDGADRESYLPVAQSALTYSDRASPQERYFNEASYQHFSGDVMRADANYRALLEIQPDHVPGARGLLSLCIEMHPANSCANEKTRVADLRPHHLDSNLHAAWRLRQT
jgi:hypothetical protein